MTDISATDKYWNEQRQFIAESIDEVRQIFQQEPASFLSERDVQAMLFATMFPRFAKFSKVREVPWMYHQVFRKDGKLKMNPVKTEYRGQNVGPIDIAVLSDLDDQNWWKIPIRVGIEIKLRQDRKSFLGGIPVQGDCGKLSRYEEQCQGRNFTGICLVFSHLRHCEEDVRWLNRLPDAKSTINPENKAEILDCIPERGLCVFAFTHDHGDSM